MLKKQVDQDNIIKNQSYITTNKDSKHPVNDDSAILLLHEEQLDIVKEWVKTADVTIHRESLTEEKNLTIPVRREELVIEKKSLDEESDGNIETIRIPIGEEQIDISKHWVELEDVQVYKRKFEENKSIKETLKSERLHLETTGNPKIIDREIETLS